MNEKDLWQRYCKYVRSYADVGITLDISRMRFDDNFLEKMKQPLSTAFRRMAELEAGSIANPDEGRMVGHYWLRSPELAPENEIKQAIARTNEKILAFARDAHAAVVRPQRNDAFTKVIVVGIGGSALGPQLVADALGTQHDRMDIYFCDNTDPDGIQRLISGLGEDLARTLVITISKSGGTIESRNGCAEIAAAYAAVGLEFSRHAVAVTCEGSKLDKQAKDEGWLDRFYLWDWVGGRTSLFSAVGLLPAALQGVDIRQFLEGGRLMDAITRVSDAERNPAALLAAMWYFAGDGRGKKDMVVLPYKDRLMLFSKYLQQLVMESLGKEKDLKGNIVHQGIAVYGNKGSTDQHAYVQQLRDGLNNFFATFIQVRRDYVERAPENVLHVEPGITSGDYLLGFYLGTRKALYENMRDSITVTLETLTAKSLGALIALYDRTVGLYAELIGINAYHQPGVEAGKKAAARVIELQRALQEELQRRPGGSTAEELSTAINAPDDVETIYHILEHLAGNAATKVRRSEEQTPHSARYSLQD
jgi:glucose-6-phosphate isomerase